MLHASRKSAAAIFHPTAHHAIPVAAKNVRGSITRCTRRMYLAIFAVWANRA